MMKLRIAVLALVAGILPFSGWAGPTSTLVKTRSKSSDPVTPGKWHCNFSKCKSYATSKGVPLIAVWSNGDACGHCVMFENGVNSADFKNWMKTSGCVFYFIYSGDKGDGTAGSSVFHWIRGTNTSYPFVRIYWPAGKVDVKTVGDTVDGDKSVLIVAAKIDQVEAITSALAAAGFTTELVDVAPLALVNVLRHVNPDEGCSVILDLGAKTTSLVIVEGERIYNRAIPVAGNAITKEIATAFGESVETWEAWNEEDITAFSKAPVWDYAAFLKAAYLGFKAASRPPRVAMGALCLDHRNAFDETLFANDAALYFDVFNFHTYRGLDGYDGVFGALNRFRQAHGIGDRLYYLTEFGRDFPASGAPRESGEALQAEFIPKAWMRQRMLGVGRGYYFITGPYCQRNGTFELGLLRESGECKRAVFALKRHIAEVLNRNA